MKNNEIILLINTDLFWKSKSQNIIFMDKENQEQLVLSGHTTASIVYLEVLDDDALDILLETVV